MNVSSGIKEAKYAVVEERVYPDKENTLNFQLHYASYHFCRNFVEGKRVLDLGCGAGYGTNYLATRAASVVGVDISADAIGYARNRYSRGNLYFGIMDACNTAFLDNTFDIVSSLEVMEHLKDHRKYLFEIKRVLKPAGILLLSTPNRIVSLKQGGSVTVNPYHIKEFTPQELQGLLGEYFSGVEIFGQDLKREIKQEFHGRPLKNMLNRIDFLRIRKIISKGLKVKIARLLGILVVEEISYKDFDISQENIQDKEIIVAVCKKPA
jgi:2-polyprenyl-3-methyl-5-hydroxy-6-metoxy-1,4-benzoquinol methylase